MVTLPQDMLLSSHLGTYSTRSRWALIHVCTLIGESEHHFCMVDFKRERETDIGIPDLSILGTKSADQINRFPFPVLNHVFHGSNFPPIPLNLK